MPYSASSLAQACLNPALNSFYPSTDNLEVGEFCPDTVATVSQSALNGSDHLSLAATGIQFAFAPQVSLDWWSQALTKNDVQLVEVVLQSESFEAQQIELQACIAAGHLLPLLIERGEHLQIMLVDESWLIGDRITYLLNTASSSKVPTLSQSHSTILSLPEYMPLEPALLQAN